jgi:hypothetical protein
MAKFTIASPAAFPRFQKVQHTADDEARAGGVFERVAVGRAISRAMKGLVGHVVLYPPFDGGETYSGCG